MALGWVRLRFGSVLVFSGQFTEGKKNTKGKVNEVYLVLACNSLVFFYRQVTSMVSPLWKGGL